MEEWLNPETARWLLDEIPFSRLMRAYSYGPGISLSEPLHEDGRREERAPDRLFDICVRRFVPFHRLDTLYQRRACASWDRLEAYYVRVDRPTVPFSPPTHEWDDESADGYRIVKRTDPVESHGERSNRHALRDIEALYLRWPRPSDGSLFLPVDERCHLRMLAFYLADQTEKRFFGDVSFGEEDRPYDFEAYDSLRPPAWGGYYFLGFGLQELGAVIGRNAYDVPEPDPTRRMFGHWWGRRPHPHPDEAPPPPRDVLSACCCCGLHSSWVGRAHYDSVALEARAALTPVPHSSDDRVTVFSTPPSDRLPGSPFERDGWSVYAFVRGDEDFYVHIYP